MEPINIEPLGPGIEGCTLLAAPFKTSRVAIYAYLPLEKESVAAYSMLALLLSNGCAAYPLPQDLTRRLDTLYGTSVSVDAAKSGDRLMVTASVVFVDDAFLPEPVFADAVSLLQELFFRPAVDGEGFLESNFRREQRMQLEYIRGKINDKRAYVRERCSAAMCDGEPFGVSETGTLEQAESLTRQAVFAAWKTMLATAFFRISVTAQKPHPEVFEAFSREFAGIDRRGWQRPAADTVAPPRPTPQRIDERLPVTQGKLAMGFRVLPAGNDAVTAPVLVFSDLFGGSPHSRLFTNVREKQSLCYYCASSVVRRKGVLMVDSGVEFDKMERTEAAILTELDAMRQGAFTDEDLSASKLALCGSLRGIRDSQAVTDRWFADRWFDDPRLTPEDMMALVKGVTREDVVRVANRVTLDTVYRLLGKEEAR